VNALLVSVGQANSAGPFARPFFRARSNSTAISAKALGAAFRPTILNSALVIQMACTHSATMAVLSRLGGAPGGDRSVAAMASAAARLLRAYATQVEALRRLRNGGSQIVRVEHVHVNEGGQALIGNVKSTPGPGR
jgi:hypothetical protein